MSIGSVHAHLVTFAQMRPRQSTELCDTSTTYCNTAPSSGGAHLERGARVERGEAAREWRGAVVARLLQRCRLGLAHDAHLHAAPALAANKPVKSFAAYMF